MSEDMALVLTELRKINDRFIPLEKTVNILAKDLSGLKQDMSGVKQDMKANHEHLVGEIAELRDEIRIIRDHTGGNSELESRVDDINVKVLELESDVKLLKKNCC